MAPGRALGAVLGGAAAGWRRAFSVAAQRRPVYVAGQGMVPVTRKKGATIRSRALPSKSCACSAARPPTRVCACLLTLRPGAFASWPVRPRSRDMGRAAIAGAMADARVEPASISALYVGNMLSGMLPDQQHVGPLLATATGLRGVEASTVEACCGSGVVCICVRTHTHSHSLSHTHTHTLEWKSSSIAPCCTMPVL